MLVSSICKFTGGKKTDNKLLQESISTLRDTRCSLKRCKRKCSCKTVCKTIIRVLQFVVLTLLLLAYPVVNGFAAKKVYEYSFNTDNANLNKANAVTACASFVSSFLVRVYLIVITSLVAATWLHGKSQLAKHKEITDIQDLVNDYNNIGKLASSLHAQFKRWFVLMWIVYFLEIIEDFYFVYDLLTDSPHGVPIESDRVDQLCLHGLLLAYRLFSFIIPYFCGLIMNYFHRKYYNKVIKRQKEGAPEYQLFQPVIPMNPKYQFRPSFYEIRIPLNETAHVLTVSLAILAFMLSLVSKSLS